jgi:hypothetical protein
MPLITAWFRAFAFTLLIELVPASWVLRRELLLGRRVALITIANIASHPAVWLIFPELGAGLRWPRLVTLLVSEAWAFGLEALIYWLFLGTSRWQKAVAASVLANGLSLSLGYVLRAFGWV